MTTIPTLSQIYNGIITDINTEFGININPFGKAFLRVWAAVLSVKQKLLYLVLGNLQKNIFIDTADPVAVGGTLERFGFVKLRRYPFPARQGQYTVSVTGTVGATIPALTTFKSDDSSKSPGFLFILDQAFTLSSSPDAITLRALTAGTTSLLALTNTLTSTAPIINVNSSAAVTAISVSPIDAETIEQYRQKGLDAYRLSPQGGASADYRKWGEEAAGVRQIYPYAYSGHSNEINAYVEALIPDSTDGHGTPGGTILTDVANDIEANPDTGKGRRPLGVLVVHTLPIVTKAIDITIDSDGAITPAQQTTITSALNEAIYNIRPFIPGADLLSLKNDTISTFGVGNIIIQAIGGILINSIVIDVSGTPEVSYTFDQGEIPYVNSITYI